MKTRRFKTAFILGAGLGTRLRPLTEHRPKPLLEIGGRPIITYAMDHLIEAGIDRFIVNTHHRPEVYAEVFPDGHWRGLPIVFRNEEVLLDTAGGLKNIEDLLRDDQAILCYNGDVLTDLPLERLLVAHELMRPEVTLALRSNGPLLNVSIDGRGDVCDLRFTLDNPGVQQCLFAGVYAVETSFLRHLRAGQVESVVNVFLRRIVEHPGSVRGVIVDQGEWHDIGSVEVYERLMRERSTGSSAERRRDATVRFARTSLELPRSTHLNLEPLGGRGSDRSFFRVTWNNDDSAILIHYDPERVENAYYADIMAFLGTNGIPVPQLVRHDPARCLMLVEDLGATDLWSLRASAGRTRRQLYRKTLAAAHRLHTISEDAVSASRLRLTEGFGPDVYRWERDYFRDHFVHDLCGITLDRRLARALETELASLAERLHAGPRTLVHRDLQSQNVMVRDGQPYLIDFQGMRFGNPLYDLGSLLCDPYVTFSDAERDELLSHYYGLSSWGLDKAAFRSCFWEASAQRLMQALGAYGFLGLKKKLKPFLLHVPTGLSNLRRAASEVSSLPLLLGLTELCETALRHKGGRNGDRR